MTSSNEFIPSLMRFAFFDGESSMTGSAFLLPFTAGDRKCGNRHRPGFWSRFFSLWTLYSCLFIYFFIFYSFSNLSPDFWIKFTFFFDGICEDVVIFFGQPTSPIQRCFLFTKATSTCKRVFLKTEIFCFRFKK